MAWIIDEDSVEFPHEDPTVGDVELAVLKESYEDELAADIGLYFESRFGAGDSYDG